MTRFNAADREVGMDLLEATEAVFVELGAPAQLGTVILNAALASVGLGATLTMSRLRCTTSTEPPAHSTAPGSPWPAPADPKSRTSTQARSLSVRESVAYLMQRCRRG